MNEELRSRYVEALRSDVCRVCTCFIPSKADREVCAFEVNSQCPIFGHLDGIAETVALVKDTSIGPYVEALRARVCAHCDHQDEKGFCNVRDANEPVPTWCILDTYFNLIVGAIERVQQSQPV